MSLVKIMASSNAARLQRIFLDIAENTDNPANLRLAAGTLVMVLLGKLAPDKVNAMSSVAAKLMYGVGVPSTK